MCKKLMIEITVTINHVGMQLFVAGLKSTKHCKYHRVVLSSFGQTNQLTIG